MDGESTTTAPATGKNAETANTSENEAVSKMKSELAKVTEMLKAQELFINRQSNELGELRKLAEKKDPVVESVKSKVDSVISEDKPFDFFNLTPTEQDSVTVYMRESFSKLPANEKQLLKETLKDTKAFNELAKDICDKLRTPKYIEAVLGDEPVQKKPEVKSEVISEIRAMLKLADSEKNATPPSGGASKGTVIPQSSEPPKRKYANGGIMSLT